MSSSRSRRDAFARAGKKPSAARLKRAFNPPHDDTQEVLHGRVVKDPFRPLENLKAEETAAWLARENRNFEDFVLPAQDRRERTVAFLKSALPQQMSETMPSRHGGKYFVSRREKDADRWSFFVKDAEEYGGPARLLLDPLAIDPSGKTGIGGKYLTHDGKTLAYTLSTSGSDETTLKFMDVGTGADTGPVYEKFRGGISWDRDGQGFHYTRPKDETSKSFEVVHHRMGEPWEQDRVIYSPEGPDTYASRFLLKKDSKDQYGAYEWLSVSNNDPDKHALLCRPFGSDAPFHEIFPHKEGTLSPIEEIGGRIYALTTVGAPKSRLVSFDAADPAPDKWTTVIPEDKEDLLTSVFAWQDRLFAITSHDTGYAMKVYDFAGNHLHDTPIPPLSTFSMGQVRRSEPTCLLSISNFQGDGDVYTYDARANTLAFARASITPVNLKDCIVERQFASSKDGTKVPMTVIRHPDTALDGTAAAILYGYGGFDVPLGPGFSSGIAEWVRSGGIYVQANLRGGGEFGQDWYDGGRLRNKQNVFDDFAACAEHLIAEGYTSPQRLAIEGGSNGGLLTLATVIQRPELFGAVVSQVPVADMNRFHIGSFWGASWKSDYGDPGIKKDFKTAAKYSPLHNVKKGFRHPPILIATDANDDRVLPWHSYKMAATLQAKESKSSKTLLHVNTDGGHGGGGSLKKWIAATADRNAFLERTLGPVDQDAYRKKLAAELKAREVKRLHKRMLRKAGL